MSVLDTETLECLYDWLDSIPLSKPKKSLARDFSDGVLVAELISHFLPNMVQMHNYTESNSTPRKKNNWDTLNRKIFSRLDCVISEHTINDLCRAKLEVTQAVLHTIRCKIQERLNRPLSRSPKKKSPMIEYKQRSTQDHSLPLKMLAPSPVTEVKDLGDTKSYRYSYDQDVNVNTNMQVPSCLDNVPSAIYEQKIQEVLLRDETIQILQARIRRMEQQMKLKDMRMDELTKLVHEMQLKNNVVQHETNTSNIFRSPSKRTR